MGSPFLHLGLECFLEVTGIVVLQDGAMRDRINCLIDSISDPFSTEIRYHHKCWLKYIGQYQKMSVDLLCMM